MGLEWKGSEMALRGAGEDGSMGRTLSSKFTVLLFSFVESWIRNKILYNFYV